MFRSIVHRWFGGYSTTSRRKPRQSARQGQRKRPLLELLEDRTVPSASYLVNLAGDSGANSGALSGDIRYCVTQADADPGSTITFDTAALGSPTITLSNGKLDISASMTIQGPGAASLAISGNDASQVFDITSAATATISGLTISHGKSATDGGGISNAGTLTLSASTLASNSATNEGGGIYNSGGLTVNGCTFSANSAALGAGIGNGSVATANLEIHNSTFSGNTASDQGGGIYNGASSSSVTLTNVTVADNRATNDGGGLYVSAGAPVLHNTLIAGNFLGTGSTPSDVFGAVGAASDFNLVGDGTGMTGISNSSNNNQVGVNPLLATLGNYGGTTQTMALLPGSPAIDQGSSSYASVNDQRGSPRVGTPDIGAFESQGFAIAVAGGDNQTATIHTAFAKPLAVKVTANVSIEPVSGGAVLFTVPNSGSSAVLSAASATLDASGQASVTATANGTTGSYQVSASAAGIATPAAFNLSNTAPQALVADTVGVFDPATGTWYLRYSNSPGVPNATPFAYGGAGWIGVHGDWNGDGISTIGVVNPATMTWYLRNSNSPGTPDITPFAYGAVGWIPVVGDWTGSGHTGIGVFDPSTATFYLRNSDSAGAPDFVIHYGVAGWTPVVGDWDGNGTTTIGVVDPATETWYLRNSNTTGSPDIIPFQYGAAGWTPIAGNWNADGVTGIGAFNPSSATWYLRNSASPGAPDVEPFAYGGANWQPVPGNYTPLAILQAATGETPSGSVAMLTDAELQSEVAGALARLQAAGVDPALVQALQGAKFSVSPLPESDLTVVQSSNGTVLVNPNAAGFGWFFDQTPQDNSEFERDANGALVALTSGPAAGRMDLLTAVLHDMGTLAGSSDLNALRFPNDVMASVLPTSIRRTDALNAVFANLS